MEYAETASLIDQGNSSAIENVFSNTTLADQLGAELKLPYAVCEVFVAICAVFGNALVIIVFSKNRKLRRRTNYYIISLAAADLLVGLFAIPFAILASIGLPTNLHACLFTVSVLVVLCTISIFCLVAVSVDRYWAILHPMGYSRTVRTKTAIVIICVCWIAGTVVGFLPLFGWNAGKKSDEKCIFTEVMDYDYLVFLYFATIIFPALLIAAFYAHIYRVVVKQLRQIVTMNPSRRKENQNTGTMLRLLGAAQKRDVKAAQNLSRIVAFFIICWFPLYTINCVMAFCPDCHVSDIVLKFCIILSHLNSAGNPLLYAYHLKDFRAALKSFMCNLLFPQTQPKVAISVINNDRGSLGSSRHTKTMTGSTHLANRHASLLRQVTEIRSSEISLKTRHSSLRTRVIVDRTISVQQLATKTNHDECDEKVNVPVTDKSDGDFGKDFLMNHKSDSEGASELSSPSGSAAMELTTYKSCPKLDDKEIKGNRTVTSSPVSLPESIFVIEADVIAVSSNERLTDEDSNREINNG